jgi:hypothetical protein
MIRVLTLLLIIALTAPAALPQKKTPSFWDRVVKFLGVSSTPGSMKGEPDRIGEGDLWIYNVQTKVGAQLRAGNFRSPIFISGTVILAISGDRVVRIPVAGGPVTEVASVPGIQKLIGVESMTPSPATPTASATATPTPAVETPTPAVAAPTPAVATPTPPVETPTPAVAAPTPAVATPTPSPESAPPDEVLILSDLDRDNCPSVGVLNLSTGSVTPVPNGGLEDDLKMISHLRSWDREYDNGDTSFEIKLKSRQNGTRREWTDVVLKQKNKEDVSVSRCPVGINCGQPAISPSRGSVVFVRAR